MNLLEETFNAILSSGHCITDIDYVQDDQYSCSWADIQQRFDVEYDSGYGDSYINQLQIVFKDGTWLERAEYDGSEWWEYKAVKLRPVGRVEVIR